MLALKYLASLMLDGACDPPFIVDSFDVLINYIKVIKKDAVDTRGQESVGVASSYCFAIVLAHLPSIEPTSGILTDMCQHYIRVVPSVADLQGSPYYYSIGAIHNVLYPNQDHSWLDWGGVTNHPEVNYFQWQLLSTAWPSQSIKGERRSLAGPSAL